MNETDALLQQQEAQRLELEEQARRQEEQRKRDEEKRRQQQAMMQQGQPASPAAGGIDPSQMLSMGASMMGGSPAASGIGGGAGAGGGASAGFSAWPIAVAGLAIGQHEWAKKKGLHTDSDAITGRALYKDGEYYQEKGNAKLGGLGDEARLATLGSSPADLLRKDTWTDAAKLAAKGGILGNLLKKIF